MQQSSCSWWHGGAGAARLRPCTSCALTRRVSSSGVSLVAPAPPYHQLPQINCVQTATGLMSVMCKLPESVRELWGSWLKVSEHLGQLRN